jgi:hypothetical protein
MASKVSFHKTRKKEERKRESKRKGSFLFLYSVNTFLQIQISPNVIPWNLML